MDSIARLMRPCRSAAWRLGLLTDPTKAAARAVERLLDSRGRELFRSSCVPGLVVEVRFAQGPTIQRAFGTAGAAGDMRPDVVFPALSITKPVTAFCAMALVERGVLSLDEPVWRRIRSWRLPPHRTGGHSLDGITLRRLLSHSAGLNVHGYGGSAPGESPRARDLLDRELEEARTLRVIDVPGAAVHYSGGAFVLVQLLIEDATGLPFERVARETVLGPLGMASSDYELPPTLASRLATGHDDRGSPVPARRLAATAASGLHATAPDLATFWGALVRGSNGELPGRGVISPASCAEMLSPHIPDEKGGAYGFGFYLKRQRSELRFMHAGYDPGWHGFAEGLFHRRVVVVLLSNGDRGKGCVPPLARELRRTLYDLAL